MTLDEAEAALDDFQARLQDALDETRSHVEEHIAAEPPAPRGVLPHIETGVAREQLDRVFAALDSTPEAFNLHPKLAKQFATRRKLWESETGRGSGRERRVKEG